MPQSSNMQIPPPSNWQDFESLCCELWSRVWGDSEARKNGRSGQSQHGVDVYGRPQNGDEWAGVQCKGKDNFAKKRLTTKEIKEEVSKAIEFRPQLKTLIFATTGPKDESIEEYANTITAQHLLSGQFAVSIAAWSDILLLLNPHDDLTERYCNVQSGSQRIIDVVVPRMDEMSEKIDALLHAQPSTHAESRLPSQFDTSTQLGQQLQFKHDALRAVIGLLKEMYSRADVTQLPFPDDDCLLVDFRDGIRLKVHVLARHMAGTHEVDAMVQYIEMYKEEGGMNPQLAFFVTDRGSFDQLVEYFGEYPRYGTAIGFAVLDENGRIDDWHYVP